MGKEVEQDRKQYTGHVAPYVIDDSSGIHDTRPDEARHGTITIVLPLPDARRVAGHQVTITIEE